MVSRSPQRGTFQKESYLKSCQERNQEPDPEMLNLYEVMITTHKNKWDKPEAKENNLEYDLLTCDWILAKTRASETYAQNLYAAMCNNDFIKNDVWPMLKGKTWSCSWRYAGGIVADMREQGDYIDWYCSGIRGGADLNEDDYTDEQRERLKVLDNFVPESQVTDEIREDLFKLGWIVVDEPDDKE